MEVHEDVKYTHCVMKPVLCKDGLCGPVPIILAFPSYIVIYSSWTDPMPGDAVAITLFDAYGVRLVQVPLYHVARFLTREEADRITAEMEGEFRLVS